MRLIVDTSRIIAALIRDSATRSILYSNKFELLTVNFIKTEISEHEEEIAQKAKLNKKEFNDIFSRLLGHVQIINDLSFESKLEEARNIMEDIDPDDVPFIAAALAVDNEGIWTDDGHFSRQKRIRIFSTASLLRTLKDNELTGA